VPPTESLYQHGGTKVKIQPTDFVLEIGSGHNPRPRSNVLCDKFLVDDTQRGGQVVLDRPAVEADGQYLPFADRTFDYVICLHVLEHVEDPALMISELERVADRGYIETPSELGERLYGWPYHNWILNRVDGKLLIQKKQISDQFGQLFHLLAAKEPQFSKFHKAYHSLFLVQHEWQEKIDYELISPEVPILQKRLNDEAAILVEDLVNTSLRERWSPILKQALSNILPARVTTTLKLLLAKRRQHGLHPSLPEIIVCPLCKSGVEWEESFITCHDCDATYPVVDQIPRLVPPENRMN